MAETPKEKLEAYLRELDKPLTIDDLIETLGSTVKRDNDNKVITFLSKLLTYTEEDQINLGFLAESSAGKSYIPLELSWYFPKEDVIKLGYASPTAFFHEYGIALPDPNDKRDVEEDKKRKIIHVDLHQKILIFLDQPHDQLLQRLRSLLSHDEKDIVLKITDKREKYGLKTKTVVIEGYPTVIFCTAKFSMADQEKTRLLLLSPEINQEKLREAIALRIEKESDREEFKKRMEEDPKRKLLSCRIYAIKNANIKYVKIPAELKESIFQRFIEQHNYLIPRHQRDVSRLLAIIKGHALLNFSHRERINREEFGDSIIINQDDVEAGFRLYNEVSEANELGLSPEIFNIFQSIKDNILANGISINEFQTVYYEKFHKRIGYEDSRRILKTLSSVGLVSEVPDEKDKRIRRYTLLELGVTQSKPHSVYPQAEKSIVSKPSIKEEPTATDVPTVSTLENVLGLLKLDWKKGTNQEFEALIQTQGYTAEEATRLRQKWLEEGLIAYDPEGWLVWV